MDWWFERISGNLLVIYNFLVQLHGQHLLLKTGWKFFRWEITISKHAPSIWISVFQEEVLVKVIPDIVSLIIKGAISNFFIFYQYYHKNRNIHNIWFVWWFCDCNFSFGNINHFGNEEYFRRHIKNLLGNKFCWYFQRKYKLYISILPSWHKKT